MQACVVLALQSFNAAIAPLVGVPSLGVVLAALSPHGHKRPPSPAQRNTQAAWGSAGADLKWPRDPSPLPLGRDLVSWCPMHVPLPLPPGAQVDDLVSLRVGSSVFMAYGASGTGKSYTMAVG